ncbi:hypothetical protein CG709_02085, partial [Lachnotalea glycerini]
SFFLSFLSFALSCGRACPAGGWVPSLGGGFLYPDYFDIISVEASTAILIRNAKIADIIKLEEYNYDGLPILDERGFALNINTIAQLQEFLHDYKKLEEDNKIAFVNKWSKFETYRKIVCHENFWII